MAGPLERVPLKPSPAEDGAGTPLLPARSRYAPCARPEERPMQARLYLFNSVDPDARSAASTACSARWRVTIQMRAAEAVRCLGAKRGANGIC